MAEKYQVGLVGNTTRNAFKWILQSKLSLKRLKKGLSVFREGRHERDQLRMRHRLRGGTTVDPLASGDEPTLDYP